MLNNLSEARMFEKVPFLRKIYEKTLPVVTTP